MTALFIALGWGACSAFVFRTLLNDSRRRWRVITRGDVAFLSFMALCGPASLPAALIALAGDAPSRWFAQPSDTFSGNASSRDRSATRRDAQRLDPKGESAISSKGNRHD